MDWPKKVKEIRGALLLTQTEFADVLGISFATVNRWENGHHIPTMAQRRQLKTICEENDIEWREN